MQLLKESRDEIQMKASLHHSGLLLREPEIRRTNPFSHPQSLPEAAMTQMMILEAVCTSAVHL